MEVQYKTTDGKMVFKLSGEVKDIFQQVADVQEVFEQTACGCCGERNIRYRVRESVVGKDTYLYYELKCNDCHARFEFGQAKDMKSLFPKRKDAEGKWKGNGGWEQYQPQDRVA